MIGVQLGSMIAPDLQFRGLGVFAGEAPTLDDDTDGRFRILNVPSRGRINVLDRQSGRVVSSTLSALDGTWRITAMNEGAFFTVIGYDDSGVQNAAIQDWVKPHVE